MVMTKQERRWGKKDDEKLQTLIAEGIVDPLEESKEALEAIQQKYFSWCIYKNFRINFGKKVKDYKLDSILRGARGK
jgi:hypothetical protein